MPATAPFDPVLFVFWSLVGAALAWRAGFGLMPVVAVLVVAYVGRSMWPPGGKP